MNQDWELKTLGDVCEICTGKRDANHGNPNGAYHFFTCAKDHSYIDDYSFDTEAILIAGNGDVGAAKYFKGKFDAYQRTYVLSKFNKIIDINFLFLLLNGCLKDVVSKQKLGNTMPYIKLGMLTTYQIPIPPLAEQKQIVNKLNKVFATIDTTKLNVEKNLVNAKELFQSKLNVIFSQKGEGWVEKKLGDVISLEYGKPLPNEYRDADGLYPAYGANGVKTKTDKFLVDGRSIIVGRKGSAGEINFTEDKFWALDVTYFTKFDKNIIDLDFLFYLLTVLNLPKLAKGVKPGINRNDVYRILIQLPPIEEQSNIADEFKQLENIISSLESKYQQELNSLEELKKSILEKAFAGEL